VLILEINFDNMTSLNLPDELLSQILDEVFYTYESLYSYYLDLRMVNKLFNHFILIIIFQNPFKFFKDKRLLISLYIFYTKDIDNVRFLNSYTVDLQLIALVYLASKNIIHLIDKFIDFSKNTQHYRPYLKEFDYYDFICTFCKLCSSFNGNYLNLNNLNRFDLSNTLEISLQYVLNNNVLVEGVNILSLSYELITKFEDNERLMWLTKSVTFNTITEDKMICSFKNVKNLKLLVDFMDSNIMSTLKNLDQVENVCI